jgi:FtsP/CotA-like multicopper oxidase with cupredoxin domain
LRDFDYGRVSTTPDGRTVRQWDVFAADREVEVAPGLRFPAWTFNSRIPGPTLRCREGDLLRVRFVNGSAHPHTMHFHGIHPADMDGVPMVGRGVISPGESFTYTFNAEPFGLHLYHCHVWRYQMMKLTVLYGHPEDPAAFEGYYANTHMALVDKIPHFQKIRSCPDCRHARRHRAALLPHLRDVLR